MSFPIPDSVLKNARVLASDIDETLTVDGCIPGDNLNLISQLRKAGMKVFLVTGRTAGHALSMTTYLNINGAIGENGGVICEGETKRVVDYFNTDNLKTIREAFDQIGREFPRARPTEDNFMRLTDLTFYVDDFGPEEIEKASAIAAGYGLAVVYSSVHLHVCDPQVNKGATLKPYLESLGIDDMEQVITIGDSPNDVGIFDTSLFPNAVGVKNVEDYWERLSCKPRYILPEKEGHGFALLAKKLLEAKG